MTVLKRDKVSKSAVDAAVLYKEHAAAAGSYSRWGKSPFDDNNVRMALKLSLDREALLRTLLRGHGSLGNDHPISTANPYHNGVNTSTDGMH